MLLIPISISETPNGFISKYQALSSRGLLPKDVAAAVFRTISTNARTKDRMIESLVRTISTGSNASEASFRIGRLNSIEGVLAEDWERVRENVAGNALLRSSPEVIDHLNGVLREKELAPVQPDDAKSKPFDDDIPF